jgi:peptidoglycan/LPS O-acetylase OafA/YrhL
VAWVEFHPSAAKPRAVRLLGHQPVLDGVRALAWMAVFASHAGLAPELASGQVAMFVFFGLSGFLITAMLSEEKDLRGRINLLHFYVRRALRLVPALVVFLLIWLLVVIVFGHDAWMTSVPGAGKGTGEPLSVAIEGVGAGITYLTNWCGLFGLFTGYVPLGHLWSLAVEEQFYLFWAPLLVFLLSRSRRIAVVGTCLLAFASFLDVVWMHHAHATTALVFYSTDTRSGAFLAGAALGLLWSRPPAIGGWWRRTCTPTIVATIGLLMFAGWVFDHPSSALVYGTAWIAVSVAAPLMVVALVDRPRQRPSWLASPAMTYIGRRSYALYLWHYVWLTWLRSLGFSGVLIALLATLTCAELSWRVVESPFLRMKRRLVTDQPAIPIDVLEAEEAEEAEEAGAAASNPTMRPLAGVAL